MTSLAELSSAVAVGPCLSESEGSISPPPAEAGERFDKADVARLLPSEISRMSSRELIRVLRGSELPLLEGGPGNCLRTLNRETLEALVYAARRCCRNQGY